MVDAWPPQLAAATCRRVKWLEVDSNTEKGDFLQQVASAFFLWSIFNSAEESRIASVVSCSTVESRTAYISAE